MTSLKVCFSLLNLSYTAKWFTDLMMMMWLDDEMLEGYEGSKFSRKKRIFTHAVYGFFFPRLIRLLINKVQIENPS